MYKVQDFDTRVQVSHPESRLWLVLGKKITVVKVQERLWIRLNFNKDIVSTFSVLNQDYDISLTLIT